MFWTLTLSFYLRPTGTCSGLSGASIHVLSGPGWMALSEWCWLMSASAGPTASLWTIRFGCRLGPEGWTPCSGGKLPLSSALLLFESPCNDLHLVGRYGPSESWGLLAPTQSTTYAIPEMVGGRSFSSGD